VLVSVDHKPFSLLTGPTSATSLVYRTTAAHSYGFAAFAVDDLGLRGGLPKSAQASTTAVPPQGYHLGGREGRVLAAGGVPALPGFSTPSSDPLTGIATTPDGKGILPAPGETGYILVGADGGAFVFGHGAPYKGSLPGEHIKVSDIVGLCLTPDGQWYWMAGANGAVYPFGDAARFASPAGLAAALPIAAIGGT
jgi:hypothetical protein